MRAHRISLTVTAVALSAAVLTTPAPAMGSDPGLLGDAVVFRESFGLRTDAPYLANLVADSRLSAMLGGIVSNAEGDELLARIAAQTNIGPLAERVASQPDRYGGLWIDQRAGGTIRVLLAPKQAPDADLLSLAPAGVDLQIEPAAYSLSDLNAVLEDLELHADAFASGRIEIVSRGVDIAANRVRVEVASDLATASSVIGGLLGPAVVVARGEYATPAACVNRANCGSPVRGGIAISAPGVGCTAGWVARAAGGSQKYIVTAGHCIQDSGIGVTWSHVGAIGQSDSEIFYNGANQDAGDIKLSADPTTDNLVYASSASDQRSITKTFSDSQMPVGTYICRSGTASGWTCGYVSQINQTVTVSGFNYTIHHQWGANFTSGQGDSGAPMISLATYGGIFSSFTSTTSWYSTVSMITNNLGDVPCLTATC